MTARIAIPLPLSSDSEYVERALPQYESAIRAASGEPIRIPLHGSDEQICEFIRQCDGILLPGSAADVDPKKYGAKVHEKTAPADAARDSVDEMLLAHGYQECKPILGICYGLQILNVHQRGTLIQHIPDFLRQENSMVNHAAGRSVEIAHEVEIAADSQLCRIVNNSKPADSSVFVPVNSSHHQAAGEPGNGLRVVARCPADDIIEALEGTAQGHFVLAVQWHPERSNDEPSRAIFRAFVQAAEK